MLGENANGKFVSPKLPSEVFQMSKNKNLTTYAYTKDSNHKFCQSWSPFTIKPSITRKVTGAD